MTSDSAAVPDVVFLREWPAEVPWADTSISSFDGARIRVRVYEPVATPPITLVWAHGGSWTAGSLRGWHEACMAMTMLGTARILSVDYRLAPEWTHPTAMLDVASAASWAWTHFGVPVAVGGDSAGGTLAAGAALWCRDHGLRIARQILAYAPLDPDCASRSYDREAWSFPPRDFLLAAWRSYSGTEHHLRDLPYLSPLNSADLGGTAPASLIVGATDPVKDENELFAARLKADGVPVELTISRSIAHGHFLAHPVPGPNPVHQWVQHQLATIPAINTDHRRSS